MTGSAQPLTEREAELLDYYRTMIERASQQKTEEDSGSVPDGFGGNHSRSNQGRANATPMPRKKCRPDG